MILFVILSTALLCVGCETPGHAYVKQHPELTPQQQKIFLTKRIIDPTSVAGLTRDQIHIALGEPTQLEKIEGADAWIYIRPKSDQYMHPFIGPGGSSVGSAGAGMAGQAPGIPTEKTEQGTLRTTIFFDGDHAVRAEIENEVSQ